MPEYQDKAKICCQREWNLQRLWLWSILVLEWQTLTQKGIKIEFKLRPSLEFA